MTALETTACCTEVSSAADAAAAASTRHAEPADGGEGGSICATPLECEESRAEDGRTVEDLRQEVGVPFEDGELQHLCPEGRDSMWRRRSARVALVGKLAYFSTIGATTDQEWASVTLDPEPTHDHAIPAAVARDHGPRRHTLRWAGSRMSRWRCDVHEFRGRCVCVCRAPPSEALDWAGDFAATLNLRHPEIDVHDQALDHDEPEFVEVPVMQLLPEKWHEDYARACGQGGPSDRTRMNYLGPAAPHVPNFKRPSVVPPV